MMKDFFFKPSTQERNIIHRETSQPLIRKKKTKPKIFT